MKRRLKIRHEFVEFIPSVLEDGVLYISTEYGTAVHKCFCGCGEKVVTPLTPTDWSVVSHINGTVSIYPSIGNWGYKCRSHYWVRKGAVLWAGQWSQEEIDAARDYDRQRKLEYFGESTSGQTKGWDGVKGWLLRLIKRWF